MLGGGQKFSVGICDGAPSTARSSLHFYSLFERPFCKQTGDPDQMPHSATSDLGLHGLPMMLFLYGLNASGRPINQVH